MRPRRHIAAMAPYALAEINFPAGTRLISLAQNESLCAPSQLAIEAGARAMASARLYPDPDWSALREAIAEEHGLAPGQILCGAGSMELIGALIHAYAGPGDQVLASQYSYAFFRTAAHLAQADYVAAAEVDYSVDVDALLTAVTARTRIVCVANPGNPTGTALPAAELRRLHRELPEGTLLLIDEAYGEFTDAEPLFDLVARGDTVIMRTFSKAYGLAGLRVGWGVFPDPVRVELRKVLNPNNISGPAQAAATAAMQDQAYMLSTVAETKRRRDRFCVDLRAAGFRPVDSQTNFVLVPFHDAADAAAADQTLRARGVVMRGMGGYGLAHCLRATVGSAVDMAFAAEVLTGWMKEHET